MSEGAAGPATPGTPSPASSPSTPPGTTPPAQPTAGVAQTGDEQEEIKDSAALLQTYRRLQEREKAQRVRLTELETAQRQAEDAKLSEQDRLSKRVAELESQDAARQKAHQEQLLGYEIKLAASALQIVDPDAALKLLDHSLIERDADGRFSNVDKALKALVKDKPYLVAAAAAQNAPPAAQQAPSVTNPASRSAANTVTTRYSAAEIADRAFYVAHREDIQRAMREGRIDP